MGEINDPQPTRMATTVVTVTAWSELRAQLHGRLILPDDGDYEEARHIWSSVADKRPAAVARCADAFLMAPPFERFPAALHGQKLLYVRPIYVGPLEEGERIVAPLRSVGNPIADAVGPTSYLALQQTLADTLPRGIHAWSRVEYLRDLDGDVMALLADYFARAPGPQTQIFVARMGGAIAKRAADATAFAHRNEPYFVWIIGAWPSEQPDEPGIAWTRGLSDALRPFTTGGTYVNALQDEGDDVGASARLRAAYPQHAYERLVALKRTYDPSNLFRLNQNIAP